MEEDQAFWAWAAVEVLRRTGARIEEMLELTHLSLRQYQTPTGEMVPLAQISPSKTDHERVIPADPELVAVLARIIRRFKGPEGRAPLLARYDFHDRRFGPPLPHLFQRVTLGRLGVMSPSYFNQLFKKLAKRAALTDVEWTEFRDHFQLRKVAFGTCGRPYGTPCQHEHACIRCPMLRLDLAQVLLQIETNTSERLDEAHRMQWLGEVAALEESLRHIEHKKGQADGLRRQAEQTETGPTALT